ncbi:MAG: CDP-alcohol phosphatidyltransferase family protein [Actinomycetota bacterium]|nr:CDP-alcohol phosphatidyltransferase family protein [Actinomycetota bacterium]
MFDGNLRSHVDRRTQPLGRALANAGITADMLTLTGLAMAAVTALLIGTGHLLLGFFALLLSALPDLLDGPVAKVRGTSSARGAFFDSVSDRFSDLMLSVGLAFYLFQRGHTTLAMLPMGIYGAASLISYQRAKAESLGFSAKGGIMERAERVVLMAAGILIYPILVPMLWVVFVLSALTVVQRFVKVWIQATGGDSRLRLRARQNYRPRRTRGEQSVLGERLRRYRYRDGAPGEQRTRRLRARSNSRSWFSPRS